MSVKPTRSGGHTDLQLVESFRNHAGHPQRAAAQTQLRNARIAALQEKAQPWAGKLDRQDARVTAKGRKLSDSSAKALLHHAACEAHLAKIVKVDLKGELFVYTVDEAAKSQAVEAAEGLASKQINHLQRLVSNSGGQNVSGASGRA